MKYLHSLWLFALVFALTSSQSNAQWQNANPNFSTPTKILSMSAVNSQVLWLAGQDTSPTATGNVFARTTNGGLSWSHFTISGFSNYVPSNICAINADTAWVAMYGKSGGGGVFRTNNGGGTWTRQNSSGYAAPNGFINMVHFFNANNGVCIGDPNGGYYEIYTTNNGGNNWNRVAQTNIPAPLSGEFGTVDQYTARGNTIYFTTNKGRVFSSRDFGATWMANYLPNYNNDSMNVGWIAAKNTNEALAMGFNNNNSKLAIFHTIDGGLTWNLQGGGENASNFISKGAYVPLTATEGYYMLGLANSNYAFVSYNNGISWNQQVLPAQLDVNGSMGAASNGVAFISGTYLDSANSGLIKLTKSNLDILPLGVQISAGKTNCFVSSDSLQIKIYNHGTSPINFSTNNLVLSYEFYGRTPGAQWGGNQLASETITQGVLAPGAVLIKTNPALNFNFFRNDYTISITADLLGANPETKFNDECSFENLNSGYKIALGGNIFNGKMFAKGSNATLNLIGKFTSIQWQSKSPNGVWVNETGVGSNTANFSVKVNGSKYFRAILCGNIATDSIYVPVMELGNEVGRTYFDLQTNSSVGNRLQVFNNKISAVFTGSLDTSMISFPDRGSFYNFNDGSAWGTIPTSRLEPMRTGWPSMVVTKTGKEIIVSHDAATQKLVSVSRPVMGVGNWSVQTDTLDGMWPRMACSAGDTIHVICLNNATPAGAKMRYYRSTNGGLTWDIKVDLPGYTIANGFASTSGDRYAIAAKGNVVALAVGGFNNRLVLYKSTNNGLSWTTKTIKLFPAGFDGNAILPVTETTDGAVSITIDNANVAHVVTGKMLISDDQVGDNNFSYYPNSDALLYWNESFATDSLKTIASANDANLVDNGEIYMSNSSPWTAVYGRASMASITANDASNQLYVTFVGPTNYSSDEGHGKDKRDVFGVMSPNGGLSWSMPQNFTKNSETGMDNIYPSSYNDQTGKVHLLWVSSPFVKQIPGANQSISQILYDSVAYQKFESILAPEIDAQTICSTSDSIKVFVHSVGSFSQLTLQTKLSNGNPINIRSIMNKNGMDSLNFKFPNSLQNGFYSFRWISNTGKQSNWSEPIFINNNPFKPIIKNNRPLAFCNGDSTILTVDSLPQGATNLMWRLDGVLDVNLIGKSTIVLQNSALVDVYFSQNGCLVQSDSLRVTKVNQQALLVQTSKDTAICQGSSLQLFANVLAGTPFAYTWKKGLSAVGTNNDTLNLGLVTDSTAGIYTVSITNLCGVFESNPIVVSLIKTPEILEQPKNVSACLGSSARLFVVAKPGNTYQTIWRKGNVLLGANGDSIHFISVSASDTGSYTCTLINSCGSITSQEVKLNLIPALQVSANFTDTNVCKGSSLVFSPTATGGTITYAWFKDSLQIANTKDLSFTAIQLSTAGKYQFTAQNECSIFQSQSFEISVKESPSILITAYNDTLVANIQGDYSTIQWYKNDTLLGSVTGDTLFAASTGNYQVFATNSVGCTGKSEVFPFVSTGLAKSFGLNQIQFFPNPASNQVFVSGLSNSPISLTVFDLMGRTWINKQVLTKNNVINTSNLPDGIYQFQLHSEQGSSIIKVIISR